MTKNWMIENRAGVLLAVLLFAPPLIAQNQRPSVSMNLDQLSTSLAQMVAKVAPAMVALKPLPELSSAVVPEPSSKFQ